MSGQSERTRVSRWTRLQSLAVGKYQAVQLSFERRSFERKLERIARTALAHQSLGMAVGHPQYQLLRQQADSTCANFAHRWNITPDLLDAQIPAIRKLKSLANPRLKPEPAVLVSLGVAGVVALFFLIGVLAGLASVGYHLIGGR
jgi:hypothetical protein